MESSGIDYVLSVSPREARDGIKTVVTIHGRRLEVSIPARVQAGTIVKLHNVGITNDNVSIRIEIVTPVIPTYSKPRFPIWGKWAIGLVPVVALVVAGIFSGIPTQLTSDNNPNNIFHDNGVEVGADGQRIELLNNTNATDPSYAELVAFIKDDTTDQLPYTEGVRVCADFSESVHNNAEAQGIKAAWVGINFVDGGVGHSVNAFSTTDRGLVFVDCTGDNPAGPSDKIAYLEKGKVYGTILLYYANSTLYSFYEKYAQDWQQRQELESALNIDISSYNRAIAGRKYTNGQMQTWKYRLEAQQRVIENLSAELGDTFPKPMGTVKDIFIRW